MTDEQRKRLRNIKTFPQLIAFLRDELEWPIDRGEDEDDLTFDWSDDLGLEASAKVGIKEIKQLRPLESGQPWGIFFINFEKKRLPIVILRRILNALVVKKRASANKGQRAAWKQHDLLFISAYGEDDDARQLTFAHFSEPAGELADTKPTLRVLGWDDEDTNLKLDYVADKLKEKLTWPENTADLKAWRIRWSDAFEFRPRQVINTSEALALQLAELAKRIRGRVLRVLEHESEKGALRKLMKGFRTALIHDLDDDQFADMYAQTITYGLFSAAVSRTVPGAGTAVVQENVADMVPVTNPFLKEMLETFLRAGGRKGKLDFDELGIQDVVELLNDTNTRLDAVLRDFGNKTRQEDPVIHFYEHFLAVYNKKLKVQRGVFYTPLPVVSYIVRSVHELLQTEFGLEDGLASTVTWGEIAQSHAGINIPAGTGPDEPFVQILDVATGTGTFFITVIEVIFQYLKAKFAKGGIAALPRIHNPKSPIRNWSDYWNAYVPAHLLPRIFGYELMMAPYAIAHMRVPLKLTETGFTAWSELTEKNRVNIYLTNSLEPATDDKRQQEFEELAPALAHEARAVNSIKRYKRFTVVLGNPPYSLYSANLGDDARRLIEPYRFVQGQRIRERGALQLEKNLQDDYVKFFAFSESLLAASKTGILSFISNSGYLGNRSLRGMREQLLHNFDKLFVIDLHGSVSRARKDEGKDENVFDIVQGVGICFLIKASANRGYGVVKHASVKGLRSAKYDWLRRSLVSSATEWTEINPEPEEFFFLPFNSELSEEFRSWPSIHELMPVNSSGMVTARDAITIWFSEKEIRKFAQRFAELQPEVARNEYQLGADTKDWSVERAQRDVRSNDLNSSITRVLYRPFDWRVTFWTGQARGFLCNPRRPVLQHMMQTNNIGLIVNRQVNNDFQHVLVSRALIDTCTLSSATRETAYIFPLLVIDNQRNGVPGLFQCAPKPNMSQALLERAAELIEAKQPGSERSQEANNSEVALRYIYSVLHSGTYRARYVDFLRIDFPRIPLTAGKELFHDLAHLGGELIAFHLLESPKLEKLITHFIGNARMEIEKISYSDKTVWLDKAQTTGFAGVPENVWEFHIGGYHVCEKWLKDRKGRTLSKEDIQHYHRIVVALAETIRLMAEIDTVIEQHGGWPGAFQGVPDVAEAAAVPENVVELQAKKPQPVEAYAPEPTLLLKAAERDPPRKPVMREQQTDDTPIPVDELDRADLMCMIRQMFGDGEPISRDEAVKALSRQLGYDRVGSHIGEELDNAIRTAVRRGIVVRNGESLSLGARNIEAYQRDFLKEQFLASLQGHSWTERDDAIRNFARWLGFRRTGQSIDETARSLINGLIRDGSVESEGGAIRRAP